MLSAAAAAALSSIRLIIMYSFSSSYSGSSKFYPFYTFYDVSFVKFSLSEEDTGIKISSWPRWKGIVFNSIDSGLPYPPPFIRKAAAALFGWPPPPF